MQQDRSDPLSALDDRIQERADLHQLRGQFLSEFVDLEAWIGTILAAAVTSEDSTLVTRLLLSRLSSRAKLDAMADLVNEMELADRFAHAIGELRQLNQLRNEIAHSDVVIDESALEDDLARFLKGDFEWFTKRLTQRGWVVLGGERQRLQEALGALERLSSDILALWVAAIHYRQGDDPRVGVTEFDEMNSRDQGSRG